MITKIITGSIVLLFDASMGYCIDMKFFQCESKASLIPHTPTNNVCAINIPMEDIDKILFYPNVVIQDFVAKCDTIYAVDLLWSRDNNWTKFEILDSSDSQPGKILYSTWIRQGQYCGVGYCGFLTIPTEGIKVQQGVKYYIRLTNHKGTFSIWGSHGDFYKDGHAEATGYHINTDLIFVVYSHPKHINYLQEIDVSSKCLDF